MRANTERIRVTLLAAAVLALGACQGAEQTLPSGSATIEGSAAGVLFDFSASRSTGLYEPLADGSIRLDLNFCEFGCSLFGTEVDPGSRAVLLNLQAPASGLVAGASFTPAAGLFALAVRRIESPSPTEERWQTFIEEAVGGELNVEAISLAPGGAIRGSFRLELQHGGVLVGQFEAPLLQLQNGETR